MSVFNEYGNPDDRLQPEQNGFDRLVEEGASLTEVRAASSYICGVVQSNELEVVLREASNKHKEKRL